MNMEAFEVNGNQSFQALLCMAPLQGTPSLWFLMVSNIFLAITSTLGNTLILIALSKESSLHPPSKILLRSMALTDVFAGIFLEPLVVMALATVQYRSFSPCFYIIIVCSFIGMPLFFTSLFTLTAISVDRLLALLLGIRYRQVVTCKRVLLVVICFWTLGIGLPFGGFFNFIILPYCGSIAVTLCLAISTCCYSRIYQKLHRHQVQVLEHVHQGQRNRHQPLNMARYRKTVSSALWVQFTVLACYLPTGIVLVTMAVKGISLSLLVVWTFTTTLALLNSSLNPILYCWKMREVRRAVINTVKNIFCSFSG